MTDNYSLGKKGKITGIGKEEWQKLNMHYCHNCVNPSTRPRLTFDEKGWCNACLWYEKKKVINWEERCEKLKILCDKHRRNDNYFDIICPVSGGKDGSYVAWKLKHEFGMHPLCITFAPQMQTWIGRQNLENFRQSGFDHILITPNADVYRTYAKKWFIDYGMPKQPFVTGISTALLQYAVKFDIPLIMYGEQGETEYGGDTRFQSLQKFDRDFLINIYYEGQNPSEYGSWWTLPDDLDSIFATWWSLYYDWDPEVHAKLAVEKCGLQMLVGGSIGTFTNYSQLDDVLQDLHAYLMFLKYGFGRCTSDASIEIRRGRMTREQGVKTVNRLDGTFPLEYLDAYLDYFEMTRHEFWAVINKFVNGKILVKTRESERPWVLREPCV